MVLTYQRSVKNEVNESQSSYGLGVDNGEHPSIVSWFNFGTMDAMSQNWDIFNINLGFWRSSGFTAK